MSCPTCDGTMATLCKQPGSTAFLCDRCGTVVRIYSADPNGYRDVYVPKLVERCREFEMNHLAEHTISAKDFRAWTGLGIAESINTPENRKGGA